MTEAERTKLLAQIEQMRSSMNAQLDDLAAAIAARSQAPKRRAPLRLPIGGPVLIPDGHRAGQGSRSPGPHGHVCGEAMSGKRTHGSGSVEQLPSGRWRFKHTSADGKRRASPSFDSRQECEQVLAAALEELAAGNMAPIGAVTLGAYAERFLARLTICTAKDDRARWKLHVEPTELARLPIVEVKRRHVRDFMAALASKKKLVAAAGGCPGEKVEGSETLSIQSQKLVLGLLRRLFNEAKVDELLDANPCEGVKVARAGSASEDTWSFLSLEEIDRLCSHPDIPEVKRLIYQTAIYTGLREGELWALRWGDLDLDGEHPTCTCRRSYKKSTKNGKTRRFPLLPAAVDTLRRVREQAASTDTDDLVFPNRDGGMYCKGYDAEWGRWSRRAGIREEVRFHDLRHTCASHLAMGSWGRAWTLAEIRDYIGHASVSMTERYSHPGGLLRLATFLAGTLGPAARGQPDPSKT